MALSLVRESSKELVRALVVLALVFLCFGHRPVAAAEPGYDQALTSYSINSGTIPILCGDGFDAGDHAPCHACRVFAGIDLPAPPALAVRAYASFTRVAFVTVALPQPVAPPRLDARPRGPPTA